MATNISSTTIDATKSKVWDTLTKPELVKLWQYGSELITNWIACLHPGRVLKTALRIIL
jgi:uncharacterized protein YndB with AHSA1/START domain